MLILKVIIISLKQLSSTPNTEETTILRLLIPNSQMGTLIGSKGARIQQLQNNFNISMIASKSFYQVQMKD